MMNLITKQVNSSQSMTKPTKLEYSKQLQSSQAMPKITKHEYIEDLKLNAMASATYDTILQVLLRIVSFLLNAFIVRHVSSATFAIMTVRLYLLYAAGLLLSREAFRRAALGRKSSTHIRKLVNLVWLGSAFSIPLSILGWGIWIHVMRSPPEVHYKSCVVLIIASILIEVATEVPYVLSELHLWAKTKVLIEGLMQLLRSILLALGIYFFPSDALLIFGLSYVAGSILYCILYYSYFAFMLKKKSTESLLINNWKDLLPSFQTKDIKNEIDSELWSVSWSFFKQGWLKEALTEGELYLMNFFPLITLSQQGVYQVVNNLGSLAARLVFRSIEAAAYKFFAQTLQRGILIRDQEKMKIEMVSDMLKNILKNMIHISLVVLVFGWSYSHALLWLYGGDHLCDVGTQLMRAQCIYVVFLAINGITEAYTFAAMSDQELMRHNRYLVLFSVIYVVTTVVTTQLFGALGFVIGNCANMLLRIGNSLFYIHNHFKGTDHCPIECIYVSHKVLVYFVGAFIITQFSEIILYPIHLVIHIITGAITLIWLVYLLRYEYQTPIEALLKMLEKVILKSNSSVNVKLKTEAQEVNNSKTLNSFSQNPVIDYLHRFLFRRKLKSS